MRLRGQIWPLPPDREVHAAAILAKKTLQAVDYALRILLEWVDK